jgi:formate dehydrogenase major subunit
MSQIKVNIDGKEIVTHKGHTILEVAKENNIDIPTLCHDEKLRNYGSCGICVVEVEGNPKLVRSCSTEIGNGMIIKTRTERVIESRKTTLELLLSDHVGDCKAPCTLGCPSHVDIQGYVGLVANKQYSEALKLIKEDLPLPASIGRVCPHPCQTACRRGIVDDPISIAWIKRYVADLDLEKENSYMPEISPNTNKKIAIVGGGPSGLSAAYYLRQMGHEVVIYEAMPEFGGMLRYGIPIYRLPKEVLQSEIEIIRKMGVKLIPNMRIGKEITLDYLREKNDAVYVAIGAWKSASLRCSGEELEGVYGGIDFLEKFAVNTPVKTGDRIAVVGGGNTAMDACRTAIRLGAKEVYVVYRRTKADMPATDVEIKEAEEEGVQFKFLLNPLEVIGDENGKVSKMKLQKMKVDSVEPSGRSKVSPDGDNYEILEVDSVIVAIGQKLKNDGLEDLTLNKKGNIYADEFTYQTNLKGVFAGGDATNKGADIGIQAIADGKYASQVIDSYLKGKIEPIVEPYYVKKEGLTKEDFPDVVTEKASHMSHINPEIRKHNFEEVVNGFTEEEAVREGNRCLECGCQDYFECKLIKNSNDYDVHPERFDGAINDKAFEDSHPYIMRDPNKCILCGMCVRICDEVMDNTALGLVNRGFNTIVKPALDMHLLETECISCGQCIAVCPTGALMERKPVSKPVPLSANITETVCSQCSVGCNLKLESKGDMLLRALPVEKDVASDGILCAKGRFGFSSYKEENRIMNPMIRKDGKLVEVSYREAILYISKKAQSLNFMYGNDSIAVSVSDRYTNEEIFLSKKFAEDILSTENLFSFNNKKSGLKEVLGYDASTNVLEEILSTELILTIGANIVEDHTIAGMKIKKAVDSGAKLITLNNESSKADEWAAIAEKTDNSLSLLKEIAKYIAENKKAPNNSVGYKEFVESLGSVVPGEAAKEIAEMYVKSKKAMIVFDQSRVSYETSKLIAMIAVMAGHIGTPRSGIIQLKPNCNSQGLVDMGIYKTYEDIRTSKNLKGMIVLGENVDIKKVEGLDFLMVQDNIMTEAAKIADVVIPASSYCESYGTMTSLDRKIQKVNKVVKPDSIMSNGDFLLELIKTFDKTCDIASEAQVTSLISTYSNEYHGISSEALNDVYWPVGKNRVLYVDEYATEDKKSQFSKVLDVNMYLESNNTNQIATNFAKRLFEELK